MTKITIKGIEYDSYASIEEADNYLAVKYGSTWSTLDEDKKGVMLINATREIDKKDYQGQKVDKSQPLKFPRLICNQETDDGLVKLVTIELADEISKGITSGGGIANLQAIESFKVGDTQVKFKDDAVLVDPTETAITVINNLLKPYLKGNIEVWL